MPDTFNNKVCHTFCCHEVLKFFAGRFKGYNDIQVFRLNATKVLLNFDTFSMQCKMGQPLSETEKAALTAKKKPMKASYNQWKWADVYVDPDRFSAILLTIKERLGLW